MCWTLDETQSHHRVWAQLRRGQNGSYTAAQLAGTSTSHSMHSCFYQMSPASRCITNDYNISKTLSLFLLRSEMFILKKQPNGQLAKYKYFLFCLYFSLSYMMICEEDWNCLFLGFCLL